jgi:alanyl-tRNA synthetase
MEDPDLNLHWIKCAYRTIRRGGNFIVEVFKKEDKKLTAEDCMKLKDWYGIRSQDVIKLAVSHEFIVDDEGFAKLLDEDDEKMKSVKPLVRNEKNEKEETCNASCETCENG